MPFYTVADNSDTVFASDINQFSDALSGKNDVGTISTFAPLSLPGAPTVAVNTTAGNLTGAYKYAVAFITGYWKGGVGTGTLQEQGNTGGGTVSATVSPSAQQVNVTAIPTGPVGTVARAIYRTKAGGSTYYLLTQINDNTTTSYTDNIADTSLGAQMPSTNTTGTGLNIANGKFTVDTTGKATLAAQLVSNVATGTAPFIVTSTTRVTNLNVDQVDGYNFNQSLQTTDSPTFVKATFSQATGTAPFTVSSTTKVTNLNVDQVDGFNFNQSVQTTDSPTFAGLTLTSNVAKVKNVVTDGIFGVGTTVSDGSEIAIGTASTTIASFTPTANGNFLVGGYVRSTGSTSVTYQVTWKDASGTLKTYQWANNQSVTSDGFHAPPIMINATTASAITLSATAGVASTIYGSGTILGM
jgi:hypothetical protein